MPSPSKRPLALYSQSANLLSRSNPIVYKLWSTAATGPAAKASHPRSGSGCSSASNSIRYAPRSKRESPVFCRMCLALPRVSLEHPVGGWTPYLVAPASGKWHWKSCHAGASSRHPGGKDIMYHLTRIFFVLPSCNCFLVAAVEMSRAGKLIERFCSSPRDFKWSELERLLAILGYVELKKGKTAGSRRAFIHSGTKKIIRLHQPHPGNILKEYQMRDLRESLEIC